MLFFFVGLFPDAKAFEDGMEDFVGGDGAAGDFCKVEKHGAEVLADEVAGQAVAQAPDFVNASPKLRFAVR